MNESMTQSAAGKWSGPAMLFFICFGPVVWGVHLMVIYGAQSVMCSFGTPPPFWGVSATDWAIGGATALAVLALATGLIATWTGRPATPRNNGPRASFYDIARMLLGVLSIVAVLLSGATMLVLPDCAALR